MTALCFQRTVDAPVSVVWDVVTDHSLYGDVAPNLQRVEVVAGERDDLVRRCVDTDGNEWTESCTHWEDERSFAVSVDVHDSDFHRRLFTRFEGEWRVSETPAGVTISITFNFEPKYGPLGRLISAYFAYRAPSIVDEILERWADEIQSRSGDTPPTPVGRSGGVDEPGITGKGR